MRMTHLLPLLFLLLAAEAVATAGDARRQGEAQFRAGNAEAAAESLERAIKADPRDAVAHHLLGASYGIQAASGSMLAKMRLAGKIREHFERAVELAPDELEYRESLMQYYVQAPSAMGGGVDRARAQAAEIARRDAARGRLANAAILRAEGKEAEALAAYRAAHAADPANARVTMALALYLQQLKRWDEAFSHLNAAVQRNPELWPAWYQIGRTAVMANSRHGEGEAALRKFLAATTGPDSPPMSAAFWRLGMLLEMQGRKADAKRAYQEALKLDPGHNEARAALKKLG